MDDLRSKKDNSSFFLKGSNVSSIVLKNEVKVSDMREQRKDVNKSNNK